MENNENDIEKDEGMIAYEQGDFKLAAACWRRMAAKNKAQAMFNLAVLYTNGQGVEKDEEQARTWCVHAAQAGLVEAQHHLGLVYQQEQNWEQAVYWWEQAAKAGNAESQNNLAWAYHMGYGVTQNNETAADWFEMAARQNHADACFNLGVLYANGQRFQHARYWWQKAEKLQHHAAVDALNKLTELGV